MCGAFCAWASPRGKAQPQNSAPEELDTQTITQEQRGLHVRGKSSAPGMLLKGACGQGGWRRAKHANRHIHRVAKGHIS